MPRGVYLYNENTLTTFREYVLRSLPFDLHRKSNYKIFSDFVYLKSGIMLSESTLRRLMNSKNKVKPTYATIDAVSKSIGYISWEDFLQKNETEIQFLFLQEINTIEFTRTSDYDSWREIIDKYRGTKVHQQVYRRMVMIAVEDRNLDIISRAFEFPEIYNQLSINSDIHYFIAILMRKLRQYNLIYPLIPLLAKNKYAQLYFIECYVDEFNLTNYYGELMEQYTLHKNGPNDLLFFNSLMALRNIMLDIPYEKFVNAMIELNKACEYHYYPKSRRLAILLLYFQSDKEKTSNYLNELYQLLDSFDERIQMHLTHFLCRIFFIKRNTNFISLVIKHTKMKMDTSTDLFWKIDCNEVIKYEAFCLHAEGHKEKSKKLLQTYDSKFRFINTYEISKNHYETINSIINR